MLAAEPSFSSCSASDSVVFQRQDLSLCRNMSCFSSFSIARYINLSMSLCLEPVTSRAEDHMVKSPRPSPFVFFFFFCMLQAIKNWRQEGLGASYAWTLKCALRFNVQSPDQTLHTLLTEGHLTALTTLRWSGKLPFWLCFAISKIYNT